MLYQLSEILYEELVSLHKAQRKELTNQVTALKKLMTKKNKKTIQNEISQLSSKLNSKLQEEVQEWRSLHPDHGQQPKQEVETDHDAADNANEITPDDLLKLSLKDTSNSAIVEVAESSHNTTTGQPKKRNRQKERLAKREAKIQQIRDQALAESKDEIDYRSLEITNMNEKLQDRNLILVDIIPDGNCLFNSIKDQLSCKLNIEKSIQELRELAAEYILSHSDDFIPFLFEKSLTSVDEYCNKLVHETMWGSDIELLAFSNIFDCKIEVFVANAPNVIFNESKSVNLTIGFYKHSYGLGEHYNSLRKKSEYIE